MTHTTTILADHKGMTTPKVSGDEYYVDANINITSYTEDGEIITAAELGLS